MPWIAAVLQLAQSGASQSSSNANGKDVTGGGLGDASSVAGAMNSSNTKLASGSSPSNTAPYQGPTPSQMNSMHFYGGETVSMIKSSSAHKVELHGSTEGLKSNEEKGFYNNVHIPRKQV